MNDLSGGQRGRASLACALVGCPEVLVLDEPTVGLDPVLRVELWERFHALADAGTTLIVSSHVMDEAGRCDRLLLLRDGELLADSTPGAAARRRPVRRPRRGLPQRGPRPRGGGGMTADDRDRAARDAPEPAAHRGHRRPRAAPAAARPPHDRDDAGAAQRAARPALPAVEGPADLPGQPGIFDRVGLTMLGILPFVVMFLVTSIAMLRERTSGTLERLLTTPLARLDLLLGYGVAFGLAAAVQALVTVADRDDRLRPRRRGLDLAGRAHRRRRRRARRRARAAGQRVRPHASSRRCSSCR